MSYQNIQSMDQYTVQKQQQEENAVWARLQMDFADKVHKTVAIEQIKSAEYAKRLQIKEAYEERKNWRRLYHEEEKRAIYETVEIDVNGNLVLITKNLADNVRPRRLTNLSQPVLDLLVCMNEPDKRIWRIQCKVGKYPKTFFLSAEKIGRPQYLVKKLQEQGVIIYLPQKKFGTFAYQMVVLLMQAEYKISVLPDYPGWIKYSDHWIFWKEDQLTWKAIEKKI